MRWRILHRRFLLRLRANLKRKILFLTDAATRPVEPWRHAITPMARNDFHRWSNLWLNTEYSRYSLPPAHSGQRFSIYAQPLPFPPCHPRCLHARMRLNGLSGTSPRAAKARVIRKPPPKYSNGVSVANGGICPEWRKHHIQPSILDLRICCPLYR